MQPERHGRCHTRWSQRSMKMKVFLVAVVAVAVPGLFALFTAITMWLWNALMPQIFKLPEIGFWQAAGLLVLAQIFFKGGGHASRAGRGARARRHRAKLRERMQGGETSPLT
jgi:hypothetical protein